MSLNLINKIKILTVGLLLILLFSQCDEFLPSDFEQEDFTATALDAGACQYFSGDFFRTDMVIADEDTSYVTVPLFNSLATSVFSDIIDTTQYVDATETQIIGENFDALFSGMGVLLADTVNGITNPGSRDTCYLAYTHAGSQKDVGFYVGWKYKWFEELDTDNIATFIDVDVFQSDATAMPKGENDITLEMLSECTQYYSRDDNHYPRIKAKNVFQLNEANYLVRFILAEPEKIDTFRVAILPY
jgi:hypothetical protein